MKPDQQQHICRILNNTAMKNFLLLLIFVFAQSVNLTAQESEHPPLSESTKKAIADYKRNPSENNRLELVKVLNDNYDAVIQNKKDNLERRIKERDKNINRWLQSVKSGGVPPFMKLNTENHKGDERKEVAAAIEDYKNKPSAKNENKVKKALNNYYDAFLIEQEKHIKDTEQSREARLTASFERFTSDRFRPKARPGQKLNEDDVLSEII